MYTKALGLSFRMGRRGRRRRGEDIDLEEKGCDEGDGAVSHELGVGEDPKVTSILYAMR